MKTLYTLSLLLVATYAFSQYTSDAERLSTMKYMELASKVNCDSVSGSNIETRICLNLEFQYVDSVLNENFIELLGRTENDSIKRILQAFQLTWIDNRRLQSELISKGYEGHLLGIIYLNCMIETTRNRNTELENILKL